MKGYVAKGVFTKSECEKIIKIAKKDFKELHVTCIQIVVDYKVALIDKKEIYNEEELEEIFVYEILPML